jgi:perosamine synthetase
MVNKQMSGRLVHMFQPYIPSEVDMNIPLKRKNIAYGMYGKLFEEDLRKFLNNELTSTFINFNIAYFTLLRAIGINAGDEVLLSPLACLESIQPVKSLWIKH